MMSIIQRRLGFGGQMKKFNCSSCKTPVIDTRQIVQNEFCSECENQGILSPDLFTLMKNDQARGRRFAEAVNSIDFDEVLPGQLAFDEN